MNFFSKDILTNIKNCKEDLSYIIFVANLSEESVHYKDIDIVSKTVYNILKQTTKDNLSLYETLLRQINKDNYINVSDCRINIRANSLFPLILLNSVRHFNSTEFKNCVALQNIAHHTLRYLCPFKWSTTFLLKTLHCILITCQDVFTAPLCWNLLQIMNVMALSPISGFKNYVHSITKLVLSHLTFEQSQAVCKIDLLPIRGIETDDLVKLMITRDFLCYYDQEVLQIVCKLFKNNVDGKIGASLYQRLVLFYRFDKWTDDIWPHFSKYLENIDSESEFYQNHIKYWININVHQYHGDFYLFLKDKSIDFKLKSYVLLESRKRGFILNSCDHAEEIFNNMETVNVGLKIVSTYYKKSIYPLDRDIKLLLDFLYTNINTFLDDEQLKSIKMFLSQFILFAHCDLKKRKDRFQFYLDFVNKIYKYCYNCLNSELFEAGCQVLHNLLDVLKGSHNNLSLNYKLDKMDMYNLGENMLYTELVSRNLWIFDAEDTVLKIAHCFKQTQGSSKILTDLISKHYLTSNIVDVVDTEKVLNEIESFSMLQNVEKVINYSRILYRSGLSDKKQNFTFRIYEVLLEDLRTLSYNYSEKNLFKTTLYLGILTTAVADMEIGLLQTALKASFDIIHLIMKNNFIQGYRPTKVVETFINNVIHIYIRNINILWYISEKEYTLMVFIEIIENSNMKKCLTTTADALKCIGVIMEDDELDQNLKIKLLGETLHKIYESPLKQSLKIRRNPETRLIIHAMCASETNPNKPFLKWVLNFLINVLSDKNASDLSISASLHCMEILISDNNLQSTAFMHFPEIIKCSVEVFNKPSWIVRNADLQLVKALIERLFGVSLGVFNRPKNIENLFLLLPELIKYFFEILSKDQLDERATIVFQFFIESQIKENRLNEDISEVIECFQYLFVNIIKSYPNHFGKLSVLAYVSVCRVENMLEVFRDVSQFLIMNFHRIKKNIVANLMVLLKELYEKYQTYLKISTGKNIFEIDKILVDLVIFLRTTDMELFNFLLLKVESLDNVVDKLENMSFDNFQNRLWLHNNAILLITSCHSYALSNTLLVCLLPKIPSFIHVKLLNILISRFKNGEFKNEHLNNIVKILFKHSIMIDGQNNYLLKHYFRTMLLLVQNCTNLELEDMEITLTNNVYKIMIFIVFYYFKKPNLNNAELKDFCKFSREQIFKSVLISEELDNDIISILFYFLQISLETERLHLYKLIFYYSLFCSTYQAAYNCISAITDKTYCSILAALHDFLLFINDDGMIICIKDILKSVYESSDNFHSDCFYEIETDILIPKSIVKKILSNFHLKYTAIDRYNFIFFNP